MGDSATSSVIGPRRRESVTAADSVNILMCTNALFQQHAAVCLASLLANNPDLFFDIVIVGRTTEQLDENKLRRSLAGFPNHTMACRTFSPPSDLLLLLHPAGHYTIDTYTRIW